MSYLNEFNVNGVDYDLHDKRLEPSLENANKLLSISDDGESFSWIEKPQQIVNAKLLVIELSSSTAYTTDKIAVVVDKDFVLPDGWEISSATTKTNIQWNTLYNALYNYMLTGIHHVTSGGDAYLIINSHNVAGLVKKGVGSITDEYVYTEGSYTVLQLASTYIRKTSLIDL